MKRFFFIPLVIVLVSGLSLGGCARPAPTPSTSPTPPPTTPTPSPTTPTPSPQTGKAVFSITDAAAEMGAVSGIQLTVDSLRVHSQGGAWTTVSTGAQSYDLLELKATGAAKLLAQANLAAGTYDQLVLDISKVIVFDAQGSHEAKLPSNKLQIKVAFEVKAGATTTANFDFIADESLHIAGEGRYILAPVIQTEIRSNSEVQVTASNEVKVSGGKVLTQVRVGMDVEGNIEVGLKIKPDAIISIDASGKIVEVKGQASVKGTIKSIDTTAGTITITTKDGTELVLRLSSDSKLVLDGLPSTLLALTTNIGSNATIQYDVNAKIIVHADVSAKAKSGSLTTLSGTIKAVDVLAKTMTITTKTEGDITLKVTSDIKLTVGGTVSTLVTLATKVGSQATVEFNAKTNVATSIIIQ